MKLGRSSRLRPILNTNDLLERDEDSFEDSPNESISKVCVLVSSKSEYTRSSLGIRLKTEMSVS
jgi:hypothetical protein